MWWFADGLGGCWTISGERRGTAWAPICLAVVDAETGQPILVEDRISVFFVFEVVLDHPETIFANRPLYNRCPPPPLVSRGPVKWARFGDNDLGSVGRADVRAQIRKIVRRTVHPDYKPPSAYNDIGLYRLNEPVRFDRFVLPVCVDTGTPLAGRRAVAIGWGRTGSGTRTHVTRLWHTCRWLGMGRPERNYAKHKLPAGDWTLCYLARMLARRKYSEYLYSNELTGWLPCWDKNRSNYNWRDSHNRFLGTVLILFFFYRKTINFSTKHHRTLHCYISMYYNYTFQLLYYFVEYCQSCRVSVAHVTCVIYVSELTVHDKKVTHI